MRDFCGYNMGDYLRHWLEVGRALATPPKIFQLDPFRTDEQGASLWPGGDHNIRVLKWIVERVTGEASEQPTAIGRTPHAGAIDVSGIGVTPDDMLQLLAVDHQGWLDEAAASMGFLSQFGPQLPQAIVTEHRAVSRRLRACIH